MYRLSVPVSFPNSCNWYLGAKVLFRSLFSCWWPRPPSIMTKKAVKLVRGSEGLILPSYSDQIFPLQYISMFEEFLCQVQQPRSCRFPRSNCCDRCPIWIFTFLVIFGLSGAKSCRLGFSEKILQIQQAMLCKRKEDSSKWGSYLGQFVFVLFDACCN